MVIAMCTAYGVYEARRTRSMAIEVLDLTKKTELNTNSMKDALVASTKIASHAQGFEEARKIGVERAAAVAEDNSNTQSVSSAANGKVIKIVEGKITGKLK